MSVPRVAAGARLGGAVLGLALWLAPATVMAQSTLERTPNLSGGWSGRGGEAYFHFLHRFDRSDAPLRKVSSSPTFLLGYAPVDGLLAGVHYASASTLVTRYPNEWELFARWAAPPVLPVRLAAQAGYNVAARSVDGAVDASHGIGPLRLLATARVFSSAFDRDEAKFALGGGAVLRAGPIALAGDVVRLVDGSADAAWGAALQWRIPLTPHSLSLQATNANTGTLQGASVGTGRVRYGFEFTVPVTLSRFFQRRARSPAPGAAARDTVTVHMRALAYRPAALRIRPGTLVRWINDDVLEHTVTADFGVWDSGLIRPGAHFERVFDAAGVFSYSCTPHPVMKGLVEVTEEAP